jgi:hypothetical protein
VRSLSSDDIPSLSMHKTVWHRERIKPDNPVFCGKGDGQSETQASLTCRRSDEFSVSCLMRWRFRTACLRLLYFLRGPAGPTDVLPLFGTL